MEDPDSTFRTLQALGTVMSGDAMLGGLAADLGVQVRVCGKCKRQCVWAIPGLGLQMMAFCDVWFSGAGGDGEGGPMCCCIATFESMQAVIDSALRGFK